MKHFKGNESIFYDFILHTVYVLFGDVYQRCRQIKLIPPW